MNKNPTTVEAQIRTRARNLPIHQCFINKDWEKSQKAIILIVRKHTNGNITFGNFFVDLKLRGIKDCTYMFNESPLRLDEVRKRYADIHEECDYNLVHNIMYDALEFAEDYGFEPHKNFKTAQYLLEEDTEDIPMIEIPLGENGIPVLEIPYGEQCLSEITTLTKTAGSDFRIVRLDENGVPIPRERTYQQILNDIAESSGFKDLMEKPDESRTEVENQVIIDLMYSSKLYTDDEMKQIDDEIDQILKDARLTQSHVVSDEIFDEELETGYKLFVDDKIDEAYAESRRVIDNHPTQPILWDVLLSNLAVVSDNVHEEAVKEAYARFPDHPTIKAWYAEWLAQVERFDDVLELFSHLPALDALTKENVPIGAHALESFCYAYTATWLNKEDMRRAEPYYQLIARFGYGYRLGAVLQNLVHELKKSKLDEFYASEQSES